MNANDLITQVHSEEDDPLTKSVWQKFIGCLLCKGRPSNQNNQSTNQKSFQHAQLPLQPTQLITQVHQTNNISQNQTNNQTNNQSINLTIINQSNTQPRLPPLVTPPLSSPLLMTGAPLSRYLLPPQSSDDILSNKKTLVLDLDETLVHSSFKPIPNADFVLSIDLEGVIHRVYVRKRPGVDQFLKYCATKFEVVVFTASLAKYADPLLDILDRDHTVAVRLFREACVQHYGNYVKDLTHLGRKLENTIIVDNSPFSYMFQPENAIPITSWFNDKNDRQLFDLLPHLDAMAESQDIVQVLQQKKLQFVNGQVLVGV